MQIYTFQVSSTLHAFWSIKVSQIGYQQRAHVRTVSYYTSFAAVSTSNNIQATSFSHAVINGSIKIIWKQTHCWILINNEDLNSECKFQYFHLNVLS